MMSLNFELEGGERAYESRNGLSRLEKEPDSPLESPEGAQSF